MQLAIFRSVTHLTYPDEALTYCYALRPICADEQARDGHLICWTDDSGTEPFAVIEIPEGARVAETEEGWQLLVPDRPYGIDAEDVLDLAAEQSFGLSVVRAPMADGREHYWDSR